MSKTRELVFSYRTKGARAAQKADERVRQSVQQTGRQANRQAGSVKRWAERNRDSIRMMATATLAFTAGLLSASPTIRASLSGVRAAVTILSEAIVNDLLPSGTSLGAWAIEAAMWFRDLDPMIRRPISAILALVSVIAILLPIGAALVASVSTLYGAWLSFAAFMSGGAIASALGTVATGLASILAGATLLTAGLAILAVAAVALATALIFNIGGARDKTIAFMTQMYVGVRDRLMNLLNIARIISSLFLSAVTKKIRDTKDRVLVLLSIGRQMAQRGKEWIGGLIRGVRDRVSDLVSAFRDMATQAANAFRAAFNRIIPSSVSIPRVSISIPSILGGGSVGIGGGSIQIPQLATGGRIASDGLAMLHAGERVVPAAQVRERGPQPVGGGDTFNVEITVQAMGDDARMTGRNIAKEFEKELEDRGA